MSPHNTTGLCWPCVMAYKADERTNLRIAAEAKIPPDCFEFRNNTNEWIRVFTDGRVEFSPDLMMSKTPELFWDAALRNIKTHYAFDNFGTSKRELDL